MKTNIVETDFTRNRLYTNANQVNVDQNTGLAQNAQDTANKARTGIGDLNDPNLMSVIEKQNSIAQFAGLTSQYNVIIQNANDDGIDTVSVTTAYNALNNFMADILKDPDHASDIDRVAYKKYQDAYNEELAKIQSALQNNANNKFTSAASATSQAASTASQAFSAADNAFSQAQAVGSQASAEIKSNSTATAKAQSTADNAFSQATTAIDNGNVTSQAVTDLKDGSTMTIAELQNGLATKVANSEYASYKTQTDKLIGQKVDNGNFKTYKTQTADLIASKVATKDFTAYQATTAKAIESKVESKDFNTYKTQTADAISSKVATKDFSAYQDTTAKAINSKVESSDFNTYKSQTADLIASKVANKGFETYKTQTAKDINLRVTKGDLIDQINIQAGNTLISSSGQLTLSGKTIYFDTNNPVIIPSANIDSLLVNKQLKTADISANTFTTNNGTFTVDKNGAITAKNMTLTGGTLTSPTINASKINGSTINGSTINTPNLNMGDDGQIIGNYGVNDSTGYFQPINGTGTLNVSHGYIQSTANLLYYNKVMAGMANSWGYWKDSTTFVPEAHPTIGNIAESTLTPAFLKLDIWNQAKARVVSRAYVDGTGLYINDGQTQSVRSMLSDFELLSSGMAYLMGGITMNKHSSFTYGNLAINGYHSISMLDGKALCFTNKPGNGGRPIEIKAKTFTKWSQLSIKHDITPLTADESSRLLNSIDVEKFRYSQDNATYKYQYGGVIDDINELGNKQYSLPAELLNEDGTGINLDSMTGILIKTVQDQNKKIGELSMRLTRLETA